MTAPTKHYKVIGKNGKIRYKPRDGVGYVDPVKFPLDRSKCGRRSNYAAHRKRNEEPCEACKEAHRKYHSNRRTLNRLRKQVAQLASENQKRLEELNQQLAEGPTMSTGKEVANYADQAMFRAQSIDRTSGPRVFLLSCNNDPLGSIAAAAKAYKGEFVESLGQISDDERRYYLREVQKSVLAMPLEAVQFHFRITGVTRGFTHQMVRQRTAAYSQESTRFAVKEDVPVGLPPSLQGTVPWPDWMYQCFKTMFPLLDSPGQMTEHQSKMVGAYAEDNASKEQIWRREWDHTINIVTVQYNSLINNGMPAEDARGLLPTNLLTQINYITDLRALKEHAGVRLCTQAQFEWRQVWAQIVQAIREYGRSQQYLRPAERDDDPIDVNPDGVARAHSQWQFDALADIFRPICYYRGSCQFQADFDRHCSIRDRVQQNADWNIPSTEWDKGTPAYTITNEQNEIQPIFPAEWLLDSAAARRK